MLVREGDKFLDEVFVAEYAVSLTLRNREATLRYKLDVFLASPAREKIQASLYQA